MDVSVPVFVSRFPPRLHAEYPEMRRDCREYYEDGLQWLAAEISDLAHGFYVDCGAYYCAYTYPAGDLSSMKVLARFYSFWVMLDDVVDDSTDPRRVALLLDRLESAFGGERVAGYGAVADLLALAHRRGAKCRDLVRKRFLEWIAVTRRVREIEIEQEPVALEEYMSLRQTSAAMPLMHVFLVCTHPELAAGVEELAGREDFERAAFSSGRSIGIVLDLYDLAGTHAEKCEYVHAARIVQRSSPSMGMQEAVDACAALFSDYEEEMARSVYRVAVTHPEVARAMREVQAGSVAWLGAMRGRRYLPA
ncbi:terpene synthase family protein [Streptomyces sp. IBSNAI002]|uniref:terpene synthase family protein n=1 Tax=Streptomyces sp. IBSNAI002 TaxID=3457500 RepID=UPI003FD2B98C